MREIHKGCAGAHTGFKDLTCKVLRTGFFWLTIEQDARDLVKKCGTCQKYGCLIHRPSEELGTMFSPCPFDKWGINIVGKLPTSLGDGFS